MGEKKDPWNQIISNELGRLAQGNNALIKDNDCVNFTHPQDVPNDRKVTYAKFVCYYRPLKSDQQTISLVVGGEKLYHALDAGSPTASMIETKLFFNGVKSGAQEGAIFMSCDLKDFFYVPPWTNKNTFKSCTSHSQRKLEYRIISKRKYQEISSM